jgi:hypothetical protein
MVNPKMWADYEISYSDKTGIIFYDEHIFYEKYREGLFGIEENCAPVYLNKQFFGWTTRIRHNEIVITRKDKKEELIIPRSKVHVIEHDELFQMNQLFMSSVDKDEVFARML